MPQPDTADLVDLFDDEPEASAAPARAPSSWKVLVVDDDEEVHAATRFALTGCEALDRPLEIISAHSASEAREALKARPDVAVILLDVVMEEHDAGLKFAEWARKEGFTSQRIILRTGQPGYAPEMDVIRGYDINDYRAKSELTQTRLLTAITTAVRSYQQIETIEQSRRGLEMIVSSCNQLFKEREFSRFSEGVLLQLASLLGARQEGLICSGRSGSPGGEMQIVSGVGSFARFVGAPVDQLPDAAFADQVRACVDRADDDPLAPAPDGAGPGVAFTVETPPDRRYVTCLDHKEPISDIDRALVRVFATNIAAGFENVELIETLARRNADLERFAFAAAHDLQEPLRKIAILSDLVLHTEAKGLDEPGRANLSTIHLSAAHMRKLVRGLLEYVTSNREQLAFEDAPLSEVVEEVRRTLAVPLEAAGASIVTGALPAVRADRASIARVLTLLIENAIAYRSEAPLRVCIDAETNGENVVIKVVDNGRGFDAERQDEIFEAFKRLHRNAEIPGSGLGLSICKRIAEHHGGRLWAESEPGRGSTFYIELPRARSATAVAAA